MKIKSKHSEPERVHSHHAHTYSGSQEDIDKARKEHLPSMTKRVEEFFDGWEGSGIVVLRTTDNGIKMLVTGVDEPVDMLNMAYRAHNARDEIVDTVREAIPDRAFLAAMHELADLHGVDFDELMEVD